MKKTKIIGWTILLLYAAAVYFILKHDLNEVQRSVYTVSLVTIPSIAWHLIRKR